MMLYHFTARRFAGSIRANGLTRGTLVRCLRPLYIDPGFQWLTTNGEWEQDWAKGTGALPYRRNEVRFTVDVPDESRDRLLDRAAWSALMTDATAETLTAYGDPDNWYAFKGRIPASWISGVVEGEG